MKAQAEITKAFKKPHIKALLKKMLETERRGRLLYELDGYTIDEVVDGITLAKEAKELRIGTPYHKYEFSVMIRSKHYKTKEWVVAPSLSNYIDVYADDRKFPGQIRPYTAARGIHSTIDDVVRQAIASYLRHTRVYNVRV